MAMVGLFGRWSARGFGLFGRLNRGSLRGSPNGSAADIIGPVYLFGMFEWFFLLLFAKDSPDSAFNSVSQLTEEVLSYGSVLL